MAANLEESRCVLEDLLEGIRLPVVGVVCELDGALDIWPDALVWCNLLQNAGDRQTQVDALQERKIQRGANGEALVLGEHYVAAVIAFFDCLENIRRVVFAATESREHACLGSDGRLGERLSWVVRGRGIVWADRNSTASRRAS